MHKYTYIAFTKQNIVQLEILVRIEIGGWLASPNYLGMNLVDIIFILRFSKGSPCIVIINEILADFNLAVAEIDRQTANFFFFF